MFSTARYFIKTSVVFLIIGLLTGLYMMLETDIFDEGYGAELISAHTHVILVGSVIMMIMGVALWLFPRPEKTDTFIILDNDHRNGITLHISGHSIFFRF
jgi:hypothetical protein